MPDNEKQFEQAIDPFLVSPTGGCQRATDASYRVSTDVGMILAGLLYQESSVLL